MQLPNHAARLGWLVPAQKAQTAYLTDKPSNLEPDDEQNAWPLTDFSNIAKYDWPSELGGSNGLGLVFDPPIDMTNRNTRAVIYCKTAGGFNWNFKYSKVGADQWINYANDEGQTAGVVDYENERLGAGVFVSDVSNWWYENPDYYPGTALEQIYLTRDEETTPELAASEMALFFLVDFPNQPELTTFSITPVLPAGASQTFTSLAGRRQVAVYADIQYKINATFTWSGGDATAQLMECFENTLQNGTPLLFVEPWPVNEPVANRRAWLLNLEEMPTISQIAPDCWTVTIAGTSQP